MTIRLLEQIRVGGVLQPTGQQLSLAQDVEDGLIGRRAAVPVNMLRRGLDIFGPDRVTAAPVVSVGTGATLVSSGFVTFQGERMLEVVATGTAASQNHVEINFPLETVPFMADSCTVEFQCPTWANCTGITTFLGTTGYAIFAVASQSFQAMTNVTAYHNGLLAFSLPNAAFGKTGFTGDLADQAWVNSRVRVGVVNGQTVTFRLRSFRIHDRAPRGQMAVIFDDGRADFTLRALPILQRHGIRASLGIIPRLIGTANYMTEEDLQKMVALGHECVAHGSGVGDNLWDHPNDNARIADMLDTVRWLQRRNLLRPGGEKVYIWPQGRYGAATGDANFLKLAYAAGFRLGRSANTQQPRYHALGAMSELCEYKMTYPIIGHLYAGAANTPDDATETTNVTTINTRITEVGAAKLTGMLMLHEVVSRGAASAEVQIEGDRLNTIMAHLRAQMDAGNVDNVLMSELA